MPSLITPYTLPSENTTEAQLSQNFSQMYILMGKAQNSRNECCNNKLKTIFFPRQFIFHHFSRIFNKIIKFQYFSRTGKTVVIFPGFPGAVGTLLYAKVLKLLKMFQDCVHQASWHLRLHSHFTCVNQNID